MTFPTDRLFKFRKYEAVLLVPRQWSHTARLSDSDIVRSLLSAKCRLAKSPMGSSLSCPRCRADPVVLVSAASRVPPKRDQDTEMDSFEFTLRPRCSSSRDHLKGPLVLVLDDLPLTHPLVGPTFHLMAREKPAACAPASAPAAHGQSLPSSSSKQQPPFYESHVIEFPATVMPQQQRQQQQRQPQQVAPVSREKDDRKTNQSTSPVPLAFAPVPVFARPPPAPPPAKALLLPSRIVMPAIVMRMFHFSGVSQEYISLYFGYFDQLIQLMCPSFVKQHRQDAGSGFYVTVTTFEADEDLVMSCRLLEQYNRNAIQNPFSFDLISSGNLTILAECRN